MKYIVWNTSIWVCFSSDTKAISKSTLKLYLNPRGSQSTVTKLTQQYLQSVLWWPCQTDNNVRVSVDKTLILISNKSYLLETKGGKKPVIHRILLWSQRVHLQSTTGMVECICWFLTPDNEPDLDNMPYPENMPHQDNMSYLDKVP